MPGKNETPDGRYQLQTSGYGTHESIASQIIPGSSVLDVGCASGYLVRQLKRTKAIVGMGVEALPSYADAAEASGVEVLRADATEGLECLGRQMRTFDHIIFADVLEHMASPELALQAAKRCLAPGGSILVSLPNVVYLKARLRIMSGNWSYDDAGIFDRTHLRFYNLAGARGLVESQGYSVQRTEYIGPMTQRAGRRALGVSRLWPTMLCTQVVMRAVPERPTTH